MVCYIRTLQLTSRPEKKTTFWLWELDNTAGCVAAGGAVFQRRGPTAPFPPFTHFCLIHRQNLKVEWTFAHGGAEVG